MASETTDRIVVMGDVAPQPHPDAVFDPTHRSLHDQAPLDGWRFEYRCAAGCPDAIGSMPVSSGPTGHPKDCPDCGGPVSLVTEEDRVPY